MKCNKCFNKKPIIKFVFNDMMIDKIFCLDCLVEWLDYIKENNLSHLITKVNKIIPIYNFYLRFSFYC